MACASSQTLIGGAYSAPQTLVDFKGALCGGIDGEWERTKWRGRGEGKEGIGQVSGKGRAVKGKGQGKVGGIAPWLFWENRRLCTCTHYK